MNAASEARAYSDKARIHCQAAGHPSGRIPVITPGEHPKQWQGWLDYFEFLGMKGTVSAMRGAASWTVPELSPADFDGYIAEQAADKARATRSRYIGQPGLEARRALVAKSQRMFKWEAKARPAESDETFDEKMARLQRELREVASTYAIKPAEPEEYVSLEYAPEYDEAPL